MPRSFSELHLFARVRPSALLLARITTLGMFGVLTACSGDSPSTAPRVAAPSGPSFSYTDITRAPIFWDQGGYGNGGHVHLGNSTVGSFAGADDFVVPAGAAWGVGEILLTGSLTPTVVNGEVVYPPVTLRIFSDGGGVPGALLQTYALLPVKQEHLPCTSCAGSNYLFRLAQPLTLAPGTYWLGVGMPDGGVFTWWIAAQQRGYGAAISKDNGPWATVTGTPFDFTFVLYGIDNSPLSAAENIQVTLTNFGLEDGMFTSLNAKLRVVVSSIAADDIASACSALNDFVNQVNAQTGKKLTTAQAAQLLDMANALRQKIGC